MHGDGTKVPDCRRYPQHAPQPRRNLRSPTKTFGARHLPHFEARPTDVGSLEKKKEWAGAKKLDPSCSLNAPRVRGGAGQQALHRITSVLAPGRWDRGSTQQSLRFARAGRHTNILGSAPLPDIAANTLSTRTLGLGQSHRCNCCQQINGSLPHVSLLACNISQKLRDATSANWHQTRFPGSLVPPRGGALCAPSNEKERTRPQNILASFHSDR